MERAKAAVGGVPQGEALRRSEIWRSLGFLVCATIWYVFAAKFMRGSLSGWNTLLACKGSRLLWRARGKHQFWHPWWGNGCQTAKGFDRRGAWLKAHDKYLPLTALVELQGKVPSNIQSCLSLGEHVFRSVVAGLEHRLSLWQDSFLSTMVIVDQSGSSSSWGWGFRTYDLSQRSFHILTHLIQACC